MGKKELVDTKSFASEPDWTNCVEGKDSLLRLVLFNWSMARLPKLSHILVAHLGRVSIWLKNRDFWLKILIE